jgi:hypothetical protein
MGGLGELPCTERQAQHWRRGGWRELVQSVGGEARAIDSEQAASCSRACGDQGRGTCGNAQGHGSP